jgi:predicted P-loop ATPase
VVRFRGGEPWWIDSAELGLLATKEQQERYDEDAWQPLIEEWVKGREHVTVDQILRDCIEKLPRDWNQRDKNRVARCLRAISWSRKRGPKDEGGHREWRYCPG